MRRPRGRATRRAHGRSDGLSPVPPVGNTGAHLTIHWLRGGTWASVDDVLERLVGLTGGGDVEAFGWGRMMYRRHYRLVGGLTVYTEPAASNMPPVLLDVPGTACEVLGFEALRGLTTALGLQLSRVDVALDGAGFTPRQAAAWVRDGNVRCKSQRRKFVEDLGGGSDGETLTLGSRSSARFLRIYDARGFTRVELELKEGAARGFRDVLTGAVEDFPKKALGVLRDFVDFVDSSQDSNVSRAPLLSSWAALVAGVQRVRLAVQGRAAPSVERVRRYVEHQAAAMLSVYVKLGHSLDELLSFGESRFQHRHRALVALGSVTAT